MPDEQRAGGVVVGMSFLRVAHCAASPVSSAAATSTLVTLIFGATVSMVWSLWLVVTSRSGWRLGGSFVSAGAVFVWFVATG